LPAGVPINFHPRLPAATGLYKSLPQQNVMLSPSVSIQFCTDSNPAFFPQYKVVRKRQEERGSTSLQKRQILLFFWPHTLSLTAKKLFAVVLESISVSHMRRKIYRAPSGKEYLKHSTAKIFSIALMKSGKMHTRGGAEGVCFPNAKLSCWVLHSRL
jgi:hypothetical protein